MKTIEDIDIYNEQIREILSAPPKNILKIGILSILILLISIIVLSIFIEYPERLVMPAYFVSENKPVEVVNKTSNEISQIYLKDKSAVAKGDRIMDFRSILKKEDLAKLELFFQQQDLAAQKKDYLKIDFPVGLELGALTASYALLHQNFQEFQFFLKDISVNTRIASLSEEIKHIKNLNHSLDKQINYFAKEVSITEKNYQRNKNLTSGGLIAVVDKEQAESKLLSEKRNLESFRGNIINNNIRMEQLKTQINELGTSKEKEYSLKVIHIHQLVDKLKEEINEWKEQHCILAPMDGVVSFSKSWRNNQFIPAGETLLTIIPEGENQVFHVEGELSVRASGNLEKGQKAIVDLENYPSHQYGVLNGEVANVSLVPMEDFYRVSIKLPEDLKTTYDKEIPKNQLMKATVFISTKEYSLLERLFQNILDIVKNKNQ